MPDVSQRYTEYLISKLTNGDKYSRTDAAERCGADSDPRAVDALLVALRAHSRCAVIPQREGDGEPYRTNIDVCCAIIDALRKCLERHPDRRCEALRHVRDFWFDANANVRVDRYIGERIGALVESADVSFAPRCWEIFQSALGVGNYSAAVKLAPLLGNWNQNDFIAWAIQSLRSPGLSHLACSGLMQCTDALAVVPLVDAIHWTNDPHTPHAAARALQSVLLTSAILSVDVATLHVITTLVDISTSEWVYVGDDNFLQRYWSSCESLRNLARHELNRRARITRAFQGVENPSIEQEFAGAAQVARDDNSTSKIKFHCFACQHEVWAPAELRGRACKCPKCRVTLRVPGET